MGVYYETIPESLKSWILDQKMLFVGTAPLSPDGHINSMYRVYYSRIMP